MTEPSLPGIKADRRVGVHLRIVPAGVEKFEDGQLYMRAAILVSPGPVGKGSVATVDLKNWPSAVEKLVIAPVYEPEQKNRYHPRTSFTAAVRAYSATPPADIDALGPGLPVHRAMPAYPKADTLRTADLLEVDKLWAHLITRNMPPGAFELLARELAPATKEEAKANSIANQLENPRKAEGQASAPNVVNAARSHLGVALPMEHARNLQMRLGELTKLGAARPPDVNLVYSQIDPFNLEEDWPAFLGTPPLLRMYAENADPGDQAKPPERYQPKSIGDLRDEALNAASTIEGQLGSDVRANAELMRQRKVAANPPTTRLVQNGTSAALSRAIEKELDRHLLSTKRENEDLSALTSKMGRAVARPTPSLTNAVRQLFASIQGQPSLARLFNLVVDVLVPWHAVEQTGHQEPYRLVSVGVKPDSNRIWLTTKFRTAPPDAFPCTSDEAFLATSKAGAEIFDGSVEQVDGFLALGAGSKNAGWRYEIVTLDVERAAEQRIAAEAGRFDPKAAPAGQTSGKLLTLRTAGFGIADRHRSIEVVRSVKRSAARTRGNASVIGAEDITMGYRLEVSQARADQSAADIRWSSLCNRTIQFGDASNSFSGKSTIEGILNRLLDHRLDPRTGANVSPSEKARLRLEAMLSMRASLDAATIAPATRLDSFENHLVAHVEDLIARWLGPPLGVDTESDPRFELASAGEKWDSSVPLHRPGALPLEQSFDLAKPPGWKSSDPWASLVCELGFSYQFRMPVVFAGGITRRLGDAAPAQPEKLILPGTRATTAASTPDPGFRLRRHERIEAPVVATPAYYLSHIFDGVKDGLRETGGSAVVRSVAAPVPDQKSDPRAWQRTVRLFAPPSVSAEFAELHGAFGIAPPETLYRRGIAKLPGEPTIGATDPTDRRQPDGKNLKVRGVTWRAPSDGLKQVNYAHAAGGFPVFTLNSSMDGVVDETTEPKPAGDAVCKPSAGDKNRSDPYYPDPAAILMVFALRDEAGQFTDDPPVVVRLRGADTHFLTCRPVAVEIGARTKADSGLTRLWMGSGTAPKRGVATTSVPLTMPAASFLHENGQITSSKPKGLSIEVTRVNVGLAPGESFKLEAWCAPDTAALRKIFEITRNLAEIGINGNPECPVPGAAAANSAACSPTHCPPSRERIDAAAKQCFQELCKGPLPEIVAQHVIQVTHAIDKPPTPPLSKLKLRRVSAKERAIALNKEEVATDEALLPLPALFGDVKQVVAGSTDVLIDGEVEIDRSITGFIEVIAQGEALATGALDDPSRKRAGWEVTRGIWPVDRSDLEPSTGLPRMRAPSEVYGFDVDRHGRVAFGRQALLLMRIDDGPHLRRPELAQPFLGELQNDKRSILSIQQAAASSKTNPLLPRIIYPGQFPDTLARLVEVVVQSGSRTSSMFRDSNSGAAISGDAAVVHDGKRQRIAVPSTKAPANVVPVSIVPSFRMCTSCAPLPGLQPAGYQVDVTRKVRLRVRMQRPWFSSGVGERLGIVLWPPDLLLDRIAKGNNSALRDYDTGWGDKSLADSLADLVGTARSSVSAADLIQMAGVEEAKLPPEWAYVTRWGVDPIRHSAPTDGWLMPRQAFPALDPHQAPGTRWHDSTSPPDGMEKWEPLADVKAPLTVTLSRFDDREIDRDIVYVGRASVPFPDPKSAPDEAGTTLASAAPPKSERKYFEAALLAVRPRFNLDDELWYCDIDIDSLKSAYPFVRLGLVRYQPLAPRELQVSAPVVEWAQIPPERRVLVRSMASEPNVVKIIVTGPGSISAVQKPDGVRSHDLGSWRQTPLLKVTLYRRYHDGREEIVTLGKGGKIPESKTHHMQSERYSPYADLSFIPETQAELDDYLTVTASAVAPKRAADKPCLPAAAAPETREFKPARRRCALDATSDGVGQLEWQVGFVLEDDPLAWVGSTLIVVVEEVEAMLPASYPEEPFDESDPERRAEQRIEISGPRFAARVEFKRS